MREDTEDADLPSQILSTNEKTEFLQLMKLLEKDPRWNGFRDDHSQASSGQYGNWRHGDAQMWGPPSRSLQQNAGGQTKESNNQRAGSKGVCRRKRSSEKEDSGAYVIKEGFLDEVQLKDHLDSRRN